MQENLCEKLCGLCENALKFVRILCEKAIYVGYVEVMS